MIVFVSRLRRRRMKIMFSMIVKICIVLCLFFRVFICLSYIIFLEKGFLLVFVIIIGNYWISFDYMRLGNYKINIKYGFRVLVYFCRCC